MISNNLLNEIAANKFGNAYGKMPKLQEGNQKTNKNLEIWNIQSRGIRVQLRNKIQRIQKRRKT